MLVRGIENLVQIYSVQCYLTGYLFRHLDMRQIINSIYNKEINYSRESDQINKKYHGAVSFLRSRIIRANIPNRIDPDSSKVTNKEAAIQEIGLFCHNLYRVPFSALVLPRYSIKYRKLGMRTSSLGFTFRTVISFQSQRMCNIFRTKLHFIKLFPDSNQEKM